jgi:hypothetical protein
MATAVNDIQKPADNSPNGSMLMTAIAATARMSAPLQCRCRRAIRKDLLLDMAIRNLHMLPKHAFEHAA